MQLWVIFRIDAITGLRYLYLFYLRFRKGIDDGWKGTEDGGADGRFLEGAVSIRREGTILEDEVVAIAERLRAGDAAADKAEVMRVPAEVFAADVGIANNAVPTLPECIFGIEYGVMQFDILRILESVFASQLEIGDLKFFGVHERVNAVLNAQVGNLSVSAAPERLITIVHLHALDGKAIYLPEGLRGIEGTVREADAAAVPHRGTVRCREIALAAFYVFTLPEDVLAFETAMVGTDSPRLFESRLAFADGDIAELNVAGGI